jgi:hypothetical protein
MFILSEKKGISIDSIQKMRDLLERYVFDFAILYGESLVEVFLYSDRLIYLSFRIDRLLKIYVI